VTCLCEKYKDFLGGKKCEFFKAMKNMNDFSKWSYYNGRPVQEEKYKDFLSGEKCDVPGERILSEMPCNIPYRWVRT
jgi:hypothetical protein